MKNTVLISGFMGTGNTWTGLILGNYFNILNFNATESLMKIDIIHTFEHNIKKEIQENIPLNFKDGFPSVYMTHNSKFKTLEKTNFFNKFNKFVYIYRNPYDTMISLFYNRVIKKDKSLLHSYLTNKIKLSESNTFDNFVKKTLLGYIKHVKENKLHADLILNYDELRKDTKEFRKLLELFVDDINEEIYLKTLKMSSFDNIHRLEAKTKKEGYDYFKTRDGRSGQYKEVMKEELIEYIKNKWENID